jgi:hypothetical protein
MKTRYGIFALAFVFATIGASAASDNVVLIAVSKVAVPEKLPGQCDVSGTVMQVWQGTAFHRSQTISLKVPCRGDDPTFIPAVASLNSGRNIYFQSAEILKESHLGLARLDDSGALNWGGTTRVFGPWGTAHGYRILDGATLPTD